ncbi:Elongation of very long chain fatty acids like protein [Argiope bruennichi]|uniref:Elongation of very long chain fatty acids protein n=1 Tax=Argiope bruennichi TaxID=94029 RepID=A0A8T0EW88_ARGBR|nr:Elongation of very long chain fatty acids like protein [Argiope bruennichi]
MQLKHIYCSKFFVEQRGVVLLIEINLGHLFSLRFQHLAWLILLNKLSDLLDTVFFVLRKKNNQVSILHVIHHITMPLLLWWGLLGMSYTGGNTYIITGVPKEGYRSGQYIETPYFPELYQFDYIAEYVLQSDFSDGHVMLMFIDYQIARESFIEIVGHNGTHPARYNGDIFRPPVIISQNHQLNLRFEANNQVKPGFRAICFFIKDPDLKARKPYTNCGGSKYKLGGVLTIDIHANHDYYDCLWNLSPHIATFEQTSFFLFISNISLENIGPNTTLEFREGLNSKSKLVKSINCNNGNCDLIPTEITVPALTGLYIRFNGFLNPASVFKMVYGTYRTGNCSKDEVFCNERCLLTALRCDGIEQCPDGRDEEQCTSSSIVLSTTPRSVAPKLRLLSENAVASFWVMFSIGVCGIVIFILVMIFAIYRHLKAARSPSNTIEQPEVEENYQVLYPMFVQEFPAASINLPLTKTSFKQLIVILLCCTPGQPRGIPNLIVDFIPPAFVGRIH